MPDPTLPLLLAVAYAREAHHHACHGQDCTTPLALAVLYAWSAWLKFWPLLT